MHGPRRAWVVATCLLLLSAAGLATATPAAAASASDEQALVAKLNNERTSRGLRALSVDVQIRDVARKWSDHMAATGDFSHNPSYKTQIPSGWSNTGENVAWGGGSNANVNYIHQSLMNSPGHKANILGDFTRVGVGVTIASNGRMYVTEDFGKYAGDPEPRTPETTTTRPSTSARATTSTTSERSASKSDDAASSDATTKGGGKDVKKAAATTTKAKAKAKAAEVTPTTLRLAAEQGRPAMDVTIVATYTQPDDQGYISVVRTAAGIVCIGDCVKRSGGRFIPIF